MRSLLDKNEYGRQHRFGWRTLGPRLVLLWLLFAVSPLAWGQDGEGNDAEEVDIPDANLRNLVRRNPPVGRGEPLTCEVAAEQTLCGMGALAWERDRDARLRIQEASVRQTVIAASPSNVSAVPFAEHLSGTSDDHGDTPETATPLPLGIVLLGRIDPREDKDYFRVTVEETAEVAVLGRSDDGPGVLFGRLLDEAGTELVLSKKTRSEFLIQQQVSPGVYYVEVSTPAIGEEYLVVAFVQAAIDIPDAVLRAELEDQLRKTPGEPITSVELAGLERIDVDPFYRDPGDPGVADLTGLEFAFGLQSISIYGNEITDLSPLARLINLRRLSLGDNYIADLSPLTGLTRLTSLDLTHNDIEGITALASLIGITYLGLDANLIHDVSPLAELKDLKTLYLGGNKIVDISSLVDLSSLTHLDVQINPLSDESINVHIPALEERGVFVWPLDDDHGGTPETATPLAFSESVPGRISPSYDKDYFRLDVEETSSVDIFTQDTLSSMGRLLDASGVELRRSNEDGRDYNFLIRQRLVPGEYFVEVSASNAEDRYGDIIEEEGDYWVRAAVGAVDVHIPDANLRRAIERALDKSRGQVISSAEMATLLRLRVHRREEGITDLTGLEFAVGMTSISLEGQEIKDLSPLAGLANLTKLYLGHNKVMDLSPLSNLTNLTWLELFYNDITDLSPLAKLTKLTGLFLQVNSIRDVSPLSALTDLQELDLGGNDIQDISPLLTLTSLTRLTLRSNPLSDESVNVHVPALEENGVRVSALDDHGDTPDTATQLAFGETVQGQISPSYDEDYFRLDVEQASQVDVFTTGNRNPTGRLLDAAGSELERVNEDGSDRNFLIRRQLVPGVYYVVVSATGSGHYYGITAAVDSVDVDIPDANLRSLLESRLRKMPGQVITSAEMATLMFLDGFRRSITDLSGLEFATGLTKLSLDGNKIADLSALEGLTNLELLSLEHNEIRDLAPLEGLANLTRLSLGHNKIAHLGPLAGLTNLTRLHLENNEIADLSPLATLASLTSLDLRSNRIANIPPLESLTNLTSLALSDNDIIEVSPLASLSALQGLGLSGNDIEDISSLVVLTELISLDLRNNPLSKRSTSVHIPALRAEGVNVVFEDDHGNSPETATPLALSEVLYGEIDPHFDKDYFRLDIVGPTHVQIFTGIRPGNAGRFAGRLFDGSGVELERNNDSGESYNFVIRRRLVPGTYFVEVRATQNRPGGYTLSAAEDLEDGIPDARLRAAIKKALYKNPDEGINSIEIKRLKQLRAFRANIANLEGLEFATGLTRIELSENSIADISALAGLTSLTFLDLSDNAITDISPLAKLTDLTWLSLSDNAIVDISALAGLTSLESLGLRRNQIVVISALAGLTSLESLGLRGNQIVDISALAGLTSLSSLSLSNNEIVDVSPLAGLTSLRSLRLEQNRIVDVAPLPGLAGLRYLNLANNLIVDISSLGGLTSLTTLDLRHNQIVDVSPLAGLTRLSYLYLANNLIVDASPLSELSLYRLVELDLRRNPLSDASIDIHIPAISERGVSVAVNDEHGDTLETATVLRLGGAVPGQLNPTYDKDYFRLEVVQATDVAIFSTGNLDTAGRLLDGAGKELVFSRDGGAGTNFLIQRRLVPGSYYVEVSVDDFARGRPTGEYAIGAIEDVEIDIPDANLRAAVEQALRRTSGAAITAAEIGQLEYLRAPHARITDLSGIEFAINLVLLILYDNSITDVSPLADLPRLRLLDLRRNPLSAESLTTHVPALVRRGVGVVLHDVHGDTPETATPLGLGDKALGIINPNYEKDYFRLDIAHRTDVTIFTTSGFDTFGRLLDEAGQHLAASEDDGDDRNFRIQRILEAGVYYVEVSSRIIGPGSVGPYVLHADATPVTPPSGVRAEIDENVLTVAWGAVLDAGVTGYRVVATPADGGEALTCEVAADETRCVFEDVPKDSVYNVTVQAIGSGGAGPVSTTVSERAEVVRSMWRGWRLDMLHKAAESAEPEETTAPAGSQ